VPNINAFKVVIHEKKFLYKIMTILGMDVYTPRDFIWKEIINNNFEIKTRGPKGLYHSEARQPHWISICLNINNT